MNKKPIKVGSIFPSDLKKQLKEILVSRRNDGSYSLFDKYDILVSENGLYTVKVITDPEKENVTFSSLKYAVTWCTLENRNKYKEIKRIHELDLLLGSLDIELQILKKKLLGNLVVEDCQIIAAKYDQCKARKALILRELDEFVQESKYWQKKKFDESQPKIFRDGDKYSKQEWKY